MKPGGASSPVPASKPATAPAAAREGWRRTRAGGLAGEPGASAVPLRSDAAAETGSPAAQVRDMFARIAPTYDLLNHVLSVGRDRVWRRITAECLPADSRRILDLCTGTGDLALEIARRHPQASVVAGDFCLGMLEGGRAKGLHAVASPAVCDALRLPFADASFDAVTVAFGVRNFERLSPGLVELRRVLRPGGTLAVLEFFRSDSPWRELPFRFYFRRILPRVGRLVSRDPEAYAYLPRSVGRFVSRREFEALLYVSGFGDVLRREMTLRIATLFLARARA